MTRFKDRYRIESARLPGWDYAAAGCYVVTVCTQQRRHFFGEVVDGEMELSPIGEIVADEWLHTAHVRPYISLDAWIVMPNHIHGILIIDECTSPTMADGVRTTDTTADVETARRAVFRQVQTPRWGVSTSGSPSTNAKRTSVLQPHSLGAIIGQFKSVATKRIWAAGWHDFGWQTRFYDHIIRDEQSLHRIRRYIADNPRRWHLDRENDEHLYM
jgi:REP element-mobilizing transposase RayT